MIGIEGGRINIVPVDFVADALDYLAHKKGLDGKCFHLTDPEPHRIGEVLNIFATRRPRAADDDARQREDVRLHPGADPLRPGLARAGQARDPRRADRPRHSARRVPVHQLADALRQPRGGEGAQGLGHRGAARSRPTRRSSGTTGSATSTRISSSTARSPGRVKDKVVVVTGSSSGIGKATALKLAEAGAKVILVARGEEKLLETKAEIERAGRQGAGSTRPTSSDLASCDALVARVLKEHGGCDFLVNNAGRSIRRGVINSFDRFHDFERTMQLNYFGALRLIMGFLPKMIEKKRGHIINISSIGVLSNAPRFSAYVASKSALDSFSACAASEFLDKGIHFTTINMPLVRTPMIAPTKIYESVPTLSPEEAADLVVEAIVHRPVRIATRLGIFGAVSTRSRRSSRRCCSTPRSTCSPIRARRRARRAASRSRSPPSRWRSPRSRRGFTGRAARRARARALRGSTIRRAPRSRAPRRGTP